MSTFSTNLKYDFNEVSIPASAIEALMDKYDTRKFYGTAKVSFGCVRCFVMNGDTVYFRENIINQHTRLDCRNLAYVKYLNLRHSSVANIEA